MLNRLSEIISSFNKECSDLIPILQEIQSKFGFLPQECFNLIATHLGISINEIYGVATFYAQFNFQPPAKNRIKICLGTACHVKNSQDIFEAIQQRIEILKREKKHDNLFSVERVACMGCCAIAPVVVINKNVYGRMSKTKIMKILEKYSKTSLDYFTQ